MQAVALQPVRSPLRGYANLPYNKSLSNRQLIIGAHTGRPFSIEGLSMAEDSHYLVQVLRNLGYFTVLRDSTWEFVPPSAWPQEAQLFLGEGGTTLRFSLPWLAHLPLRSRISVAASLQKRPILPLIEALKQTGVRLHTAPGLYPLLIEGDPTWSPSYLEIDSSLSSQFLSALFLLAPQLRIGTHLIDRAEKPATPSYAALTLSLLAQKGWVWEPQDNGWTLSAKPDVACPLQYKGEKDWNAGGYFWGWIALGAGSLTLSLSMEALQPERQLFPTLPWPVYFQVTAEGIHIESREAVLPPLDIDISDYPDTVPVLAVVSAFASGTSRLSGIHTLPHKESHRLRALATELARVGAHLTWDDTALWIEPLSRMPDYPIVLDSHRDHRIAMALSLLASRSKAPIYITSPECVAKSYPTYWQTLAAVGVECTFVS